MVTIKEQLAAFKEVPIAYIWGDPYGDFKHWDFPKEPGISCAFLIDDPLWDIAFDNGYGGEEQPPMRFYSKSYIYVVREYDGATSLAQIPRSALSYEMPEYL